MNESILTSTKKRLGLTEDNEQFDEDVLMDINTVLNIVIQLGAGPQTGFVVSDKTSKWSDFLGEDESLLQMVKDYVFIRVKLLFDTNSLTSSVIQALTDSYHELEWRIHDYVNYEKEDNSNG